MATKEYNLKNKDWINSKERLRRKIHNAEFKRLSKLRDKKLKSEVFSHYCNGFPRCMCCGETQIKFLTLDHINNDGGKFRKEIRVTGRNFYRWLKARDFPKEIMLQLLCFNCNCAKGAFGICPHKEILNEDTQN